MLILTRRVGESVKLDLQAHVDSALSVGELFAGGPIEVVVHRVARKQVTLGIHASPHVLILREELYAARTNKG